MDIHLNENKELKILVVASTKEKARQIVREFLKIEREETIYFEKIDDILIKLQIRWPENNSTIQWRVVVDFMIIYIEDDEDWSKIAEYVEARAGILFKTIIYHNSVDYIKLNTEQSKLGCDLINYDQLLKGDLKSKIITSFKIFNKAFRKMFRLIEAVKKGFIDNENLQLFGNQNNIDNEELIEIYKLISKPIKPIINSDSNSLNNSSTGFNKSFIRTNSYSSNVIYFLDFRNLWMTSRHNFPKFKMCINRQLHKILYEEMNLSKMIQDKICLTVFFKQLEKEIKTSAKLDDNNISVFNLNLISNSDDKIFDHRYSGLTLSGKSNFGINYIEFEKTLPNYLRFGNNLELFFCVDYKIKNNFSFYEEKLKFYEILNSLKIYDLLNLNKCNLRLINDRVFIDFYNSFNKIKKSDTEDIDNFIKLVKENKVDLLLNINLKTNLTVGTIQNIKHIDDLLDFKLSINLECLNIKPLLTKLNDFYKQSINKDFIIFLINYSIFFFTSVVDNTKINLDFNLKQFIEILTDIPNNNLYKDLVMEYISKVGNIIKNLLDFRSYVQTHCKIFDNTDHIITINICLSPFIILSLTLNFDY